MRFCYWKTRCAYSRDTATIDRTGQFPNKSINPDTVALKRMMNYSIRLEAVVEV
jgi:hypothetical protein